MKVIVRGFKSELYISENEAYITSPFGINDTNKLDVDRLVMFPLVRQGGGSFGLGKLKMNDDNFPELDFDDSVSLTKLINELNDISNAHRIIKDFGFDVEDFIMDRLVESVKEVNKLLLKANKKGEVK